jgi:hypothetical protein
MVLHSGTLGASQLFLQKEVAVTSLEDWLAPGSLPPSCDPSETSADDAVAGALNQGLNVAQQSSPALQSSGW